MSQRPDRRPDRVAGRPLSPRAFRTFGIEAVVLGSPTRQEGLLRRDGVALWRRLDAHAPLFDRVADETPEGVAGAVSAAAGLLPIRVVTAATPGRDRGMRVPALGERATRALQLASGPPPRAGWLLLVDEGPGETWLYLADEQDPADALREFLGRRGRTDFGRVRRRSRAGGLGSAGLLLGLVLIVWSGALGLGLAGQLLGVAALFGSITALVRARPR
ncbi:MAG TPA: hypothetical protein VF995_06590 [Actinomycetota bacterium]